MKALARTVTLALLMASTSSGCAAIAPLPAVGGAEHRAERRAEQAIAALEAEDFDLARSDLLSLAADCRSGRHGRDALLLLAAAELDTGNPDGSPRRATQLAASYLLLPDASPESIPLARALYRLGVDRSPPAASPLEPDSLPTIAPRFEACDADVPLPPSGPLPSTPTPRASELAALRAELEARSDTLGTLRAELARRSLEIAELQTEIARIMDLLKSGVLGRTRHLHR